MTVETTVELAGGVVVAVGSPSDGATFTLTEDACDDRRAVTVPSVPDALAELTDRCQHRPHAAAICDDVLRTLDPAAPAFAGLITDRWPTRPCSRAWSSRAGWPNAAPPRSPTSPIPWRQTVTATVC